MMTEELKRIEDGLLRINERLADLETRVATTGTLTPFTSSAVNEGSANGSGTADGDPTPVPTEQPGDTASVDSDYWAAAVQVGLALSQGGGLKNWQTAVAALLPAVAQGVDRSLANQPVLKAALVPAALSGAAYYIGRQAAR